MTGIASSAACSTARAYSHSEAARGNAGRVMPPLSASPTSPVVGGDQRPSAIARQQLVPGGRGRRPQIDQQLGVIGHDLARDAAAEHPDGDQPPPLRVG